MTTQEFSNQLGLLERRLVADPRAFRELFTADGMEAVAWEFRQPALGAKFTRQLWEVLSRDDDSSRLLMRFLWQLPVGKKRMFIRALDEHLSGRYPMFAGLSENWPAGNAIGPYIRKPSERDPGGDALEKVVGLVRAHATQDQSDRTQPPGPVRREVSG